MYKYALNGVEEEFRVLEGFSNKEIPQMTIKSLRVEIKNKEKKTKNCGRVEEKGTKKTGRG